jgi:hypothetical protein
MARLNSLIALLCLSLPCAAQEIFPGPIMRTIAAAGGGATYLVDQDFEGAGYDNGETWTEAGSGTKDEDYTGTVLDGSQSLRIAQSSQNATTQTTFTANDEVWVYALFRPVSIPASTQTILEVKNNTTSLVQLRHPGDGHLRVQGSTTATTVGLVSAGTTYHIWLRYVKGTGANAIASIGFSTDGTRPTSGNNFAQFTTGDATLQADVLVIGGPGITTQEHIWDKVRVDDVVIGDNPT